jgi:dephospho-CoA kinase
VATSERDVIVVDAIKLIEGGYAREVDSLWVVTCPRAAQVERLVASRGLTAEEAALRIDAQGPQEDKARLADVVIHNDGTREALEARVRRAYAETLARGRSRRAQEGVADG